MITSVSPQVARSWLLLSAWGRDFDAAAQSQPDQIVLDLEDGVDPRHKAAARDDVVDWLRESSAWIRINERSSEEWQRDIDALRGCKGLKGVVLAKTESADEVSETFDRLGRKSPVLPLIESAIGIESASSIAASRGTIRLAFGSGDYRRDTGTAADDLAMAYPRSRLVIASRVAGLPGPIDGPTVSASHPVVRRQSEVAVSLGMTGRLCLSVEQVPLVNEVMSPAPSDVSWAREFLNDFELRGRVVRDGSDPPRLKRAEKIAHLAEVFGVGQM